MLPKIKYHLLLATALSFAVINTVEVKQFTPQHSQWLTLDSEAHARKSGGRSGGGSFKKRSSPPSGSRNTSPSRNNSPSRNTSPSNNDSYRRRNNSGGSSTIVVPGNRGSNYGTSSYNGNPWVNLALVLFLLSLLAILLFTFVYKLLKMSGGSSGAVAAAARERDNDIVTSVRDKLQVLAILLNLAETIEINILNITLTTSLAILTLSTPHTTIGINPLISRNEPNCLNPN
ncbi:MAG: hypothetical protein ACLFT0_04805 [Spirulinaceae cyanobacterium]